MDIGGWIAQLATQMRAMHDLAGDCITTAQRFRRTGHVAIGQLQTQSRAGYALAFGFHRVDFLGEKTVLGAELSQHGDIAAATIAKTKFRTDPDFARGQPARQYGLDEVL